MEMDIKKIVEQQVEKEVQDFNFKEIIQAEVRNIIKNGVGKEIIESVSLVAKHMIAEEVRIALDGEVTTDDGWGKKVTYPSFEGLFRAKFRKEMEEKYEVKKEIERQVAQRVASLIKQDYTKVIEKIVDELSGTKLVKKE